MASIRKSEFQKIGLINHGDYLDIVIIAGVNRKIKFSTIKEAVNNSVANYIDVKSKDGIIYRLTINNKDEVICQDAEAYSINNPFNSDGNLNKELGYINLMGTGEIEETQGVKYFEKAYPMLMTKNIGCRRLNFYDTDNNEVDCRAINWKTCDVTFYKPRCVKDCKWDLYFNKDDFIARYDQDMIMKI